MTTGPVGWSAPANSGPVERASEAHWKCRRCCDKSTDVYKNPKDPDVICSTCSSPLTLKERQVEVFYALALEERRMNAFNARAGPKKQTTEAFTMRAASRALGIDRNRTLKDLVKNGQLSTIVVNGRPRISRAEIERYLAQGDSVASSERAPRKRQHSPPRSPKSSATPGADIRRIRL